MTTKIKKRRKKRWRGKCHILCTYITEKGDKCQNAYRLFDFSLDLKSIADCVVLC